MDIRDATISDKYDRSRFRIDVPYLRKSGGRSWMLYHDVMYVLHPDIVNACQLMDAAADPMGDADIPFLGYVYGTWENGGVPMYTILLEQYIGKQDITVEHV